MLVVIAVAATQSGGVDRVKWLTGCWEAATGPRIVREHWTAPANGEMQETGTTTRRDSLIESERVRLFARGGQLVYEAHPSGQSSAEFTSTTINDSTVVFSNPAHDFPKTVAYRIRGDSLFARVEGSRPGSMAIRMIDFQYRRVTCAAR